MSGIWSVLLGITKPKMNRRRRTSRLSGEHWDMTEFHKSSVSGNEQFPLFSKYSYVFEIHKYLLIIRLLTDQKADGVAFNISPPPSPLQKPSIPLVIITHSNPPNYLAPPPYYQAPPNYKAPPGSRNSAQI